MRSHNHPIILFIDRFGFSIYQDTLTNIPKFNFTPDLVANLDVVNKEQFSNLIATFIQINKIVPSSLTILLSDTVIYVKDLINPLQKPSATDQPLLNPPPSLNSADKEHKEEIQNFLENIPFEEVLAKVVKIDQTDRVVAANKELVMIIAESFVNKGCVLDAVIPGFLFLPKANFALGLTQENIQAVLNDSEILKDGNLLTNQQKVAAPAVFAGQKEPISGEKKPQNMRQFILIGVFVTLLVIFAVVYLNLGASKTPLSKKIKSSSVEAVNIPSVAVTAIPTLASAPLTAAPLDLKSIKIKILQNNESNAIANDLKNGLSQLGFEEVIIENSQGTIPEKSSVIFSQNVPSDLRNNVIAEVKKILFGISILENQDSNSTITILIGRS